MKRTHRSAGAVLVSPDPADAAALLLDQVRTTGERQVVAPKGTLEPGEPPLIAAAREVREEVGITDLTYIAYLGQQSYGFLDREGQPADKTVAWFLFATRDHDVAPRVAEGFVDAQWLPLAQAAEAATHPEFRAYLYKAWSIIAWRQRGDLPYSAAMSDVVWSTAEQASALVRNASTAGVGLCGSAARGDFVDHWSDIDIIAWGIDPTSDLATGIMQLATAAEQGTGIHTSVRLADQTGRDANHAGPLYDMKLQAVLRRTGLDVAVIAGTAPSLPLPEVDGSDLGQNIEALQSFAVRLLGQEPLTAAERTDRARRALSVMCSAARNLATRIEPVASLRLPTVVRLLRSRWPDGSIVTLLCDYDDFRQQGAADLDRAEALAAQVPATLSDLRDLVAAEPALS